MLVHDVGPRGSRPPPRYASWNGQPWKRLPACYRRWLISGRAARRRRCRWPAAGRPPAWWMWRSTLHQGHARSRRKTCVFDTWACSVSRSTPVAWIPSRWNRTAARPGSARALGDRRGQPAGRGGPCSTTASKHTHGLHRPANGGVANGMAAETAAGVPSRGSGRLRGEASVVSMAAGGCGAGPSTCPFIRRSVVERAFDTLACTDSRSTPGGADRVAVDRASRRVVSERVVSAGCDEPAVGTVDSPVARALRSVHKHSKVLHRSTRQSAGCTAPLGGKAHGSRPQVANGWRSSDGASRYPQLAGARPGPTSSVTWSRRPSSMWATFATDSGPRGGGRRDHRILGRCDLLGVVERSALSQVCNWRVTIEAQHDFGLQSAGESLVAQATARRSLVGESVIDDRRGCTC